MLYVPVTVNGRPVKAFVDSGAQTTIMSPDCAETCGISYLIDERYAGIAKGVGTARILGRVHHAKIQVGDAELDCAFTVMEGKDVDLLFGLDMLKRHQACIDLKRGKLTLPHTEVDFLPESEIPRRDDSAFADAPLEPGPSAVAPARPPAASSSSSSSAAPGPLAAAAVPSSLTPVPSSLTPVGQRQVPPPTAGAGSPHPQGQAQQARARPPRPQGQPPPAAAAAAFPEESVRMLMGMGASRVEAVQALEAAGGNVELAAGILFN
jgi:DNA damage-inducible protein 1